MEQPVFRRVVSGRTPEGRWGVLEDSSVGPTDLFDVQGQPFATAHFLALDELSLGAADKRATATLGEIFSLVPGSVRFFIESMAPTPEPSGWHRTNTIDLEYVISGEIDLFMEDASSVTLRQGDLNIQLGGNHQWWNRSSEPCVLLIVMIGVSSDETPGVASGPPIGGTAGTGEGGGS